MPASSITASSSNPNALFRSASVAMLSMSSADSGKEEMPTRGSWPGRSGGRLPSAWTCGRSSRWPACPRRCG
eukprot:7389300-Prymnesium_polylepis.1